MAPDSNAALETSRYMQTPSRAGGPSAEGRALNLEQSRYWIVLRATLAED